jgi:hypothetical protein
MWEKSRRRLWEDLSTADFLLDFHQVQKESGREQFSLFPELTLKELVFLFCKYYSIFLLHQEASACIMRAQRRKKKRKGLMC